MKLNLVILVLLVAILVLLVAYLRFVMGAEIGKTECYTNDSKGLCFSNCGTPQPKECTCLGYESNRTGIPDSPTITRCIGINLGQTKI